MPEMKILYGIIPNSPAGMSILSLGSFFVFKKLDRVGPIVVRWIGNQILPHFDLFKSLVLEAKIPPHPELPCEIGLFKGVELKH